MLEIEKTPSKMVKNKTRKNKHKEVLLWTERLHLQNTDVERWENI